MILFKRVGESFSRIEGREWALLFLETVGVVAGILIAFELNEWASRRSEAARRQNQLERLFAEAEDDVGSLRYQRDLLKQMTDNERTFATTLVHLGKCPPASQWSSLDNVTKFPGFDVAQAVYQEMMGAGGLSTIENTYVRRTISDFHSQLEFYESQNAFFRQRITEPVSDDDARASVSFDPQAEDPTTTTYDQAALCADHGFRNRVALAVRNHRVLAFGAREKLTAFAIKMCTAIGSELGRTCVPRDSGPLVGRDAAMAEKALREMKAAGAD